MIMRKSSIVDNRLGPKYASDKKYTLLSLQVLFHEMRSIQKGCNELEEGYQPAITFIVAVKRHHGRFKILSREEGVNCSFSFYFFIYQFFVKTKQKNSRNNRNS